MVIATMTRLANLMVAAMQVNADRAQPSQSHVEPHAHEEHSHAHAEHSSETHAHSGPSDSHSAQTAGHTHSHDHHDHVHDDRVSSVSAMLDGSMDSDNVNSFLGYLISSNPENMYRCKGIISVDGADDRVVFQVSSPAVTLQASCSIAPERELDCVLGCLVVKTERNCGFCTNLQKHLNIMKLKILQVLERSCSIQCSACLYYFP